MATSGGFENTLVGVEEIGALFLATRGALNFLCSSVTSILVVGFEAGDTDVTFVEEPRETGDHIVLALFLCNGIICFGWVGPILLKWYV